jgi:hypothetical protein
VSHLLGSTPIFLRFAFVGKVLSMPFTLGILVYTILIVLYLIVAGHSCQTHEQHHTGKQKQ